MSIRDRVIYLDNVAGMPSELFGSNEIRTPPYFGPPAEGTEVFYAIINAAHVARKKMRSCYIRWALTVNAIHAAGLRYKNHSEIGLNVMFIRQRECFAPNFYPIIQLDNQQTQDNTRRSLDIISAYGIYDIYGCFEEIIFELYESYLCYKPDILLSGDEFRPLRRLYRHRVIDSASEEEWKVAFSKRLSDWRRKKTYSPLSKTFEAFLHDSGLMGYGAFSDEKNVNGFIRVIDIASELRNIITHGGHVVTERLSELCLDGLDMLFPFKKDMEIRVTNENFSAIEYYFDAVIFDIYYAAAFRFFQ